MWAFSIYLEAVAIMPQLLMVSKTGEAENITSHYLFALGSYRALYIVNWIYRYYTEGVFDRFAVFAGLIQTVLYVDFFYLYITKGALARHPCYINPHDTLFPLQHNLSHHRISPCLPSQSQPLFALLPPPFTNSCRGLIPSLVFDGMHTVLT